MTLTDDGSTTNLFGEAVDDRRAAVKKRLGALSSPLPDPQLRVLSLGAGVQSSVLALMSARGDLERLDFAIFADTGWEKKATYDYLDWLEKQCPFPILRPRRDGLDLGEFVLETVNMPVTGRQTPPFFTKMPDGTIGMWPKQCSKEFKTRVVQRAIRDILGIGYGERGPTEPIVEQWLGMSTDELHRMAFAEKKYIHHRYPLVEQRLSRTACIPWLERRQLRIPPKSSCIFCPLQRLPQWRDVKDSPEDWARLVPFDRAMRKGHLGFEGEVFLTRHLLPIEDVDLSTVEERGQSAFDMDGEIGCGDFECGV